MRVYAQGINAMISPKAMISLRDDIAPDGTMISKRCLGCGIFEIIGEANER